VIEILTLGIILGFIICALNAFLLIYFLDRHSQVIHQSIKTVERQIKGKAVIYEPDEDRERFADTLRQNGEDGKDTLLEDL